MPRENTAASGSRRGAFDQPERLRDCLKATKALVRSSRGSDGDERSFFAQTAYNLDVRAFEIAVECALFFEAIEERALDWNDEARKSAGMTLAETAELGRSIEERLSLPGAARIDSNNLLAALDSLSRTVGRIRARLESLCRSLVITELCSLALVSRVRTGQHASGGGRATVPMRVHVSSTGIDHEL